MCGKHYYAMLQGRASLSTTSRYCSQITLVEVTRCKQPFPVSTGFGQDYSTQANTHSLESFVVQFIIEQMILTKELTYLAGFHKALCSLFHDQTHARSLSSSLVSRSRRLWTRSVPSLTLPSELAWCFSVHLQSSFSNKSLFDYLNFCVQFSLALLFILSHLISLQSHSRIVHLSKKPCRVLNCPAQLPVLSYKSTHSHSFTSFCI